MTPPNRRKTSRVLNDDSYLLGLSYNDITGTSIVVLGVVILSKALGVTSMAWVILLALSILILLVPIRLRFRRKIIRDSLKYIFTKKVQNVSKNR